jgi:hypothetical protein
VLSECRVDVRSYKVTSMDVVAIALGIAMFAILLGLIWGIDRI